MSTTALLCIALISVLLLLFLVIRMKVSAFVSLLLVSMITALIAGIPVDKVMPTLIAGMGSTLGSITIIVGLGAILGKMIEVSGGAEALASYFTIAGFILGIPIFVDVGFIILAPIVLGFARFTKANPIVYGLPVAAAMLTVHVVVPPHPGPVAAANILHADVGMLTLLGILLCIPTSICAFYFARSVIRKHLAAKGESAEIRTDITSLNMADIQSDRVKLDNLEPPSVGLILTLVILPIALIMLGTVSATVLDKASSLYRVAQFLGSPGTALMISILLAFYFIGIKRGWELGRIGEVMDDALPTAAVVILVTGGGGVFGKVLTETGVGTALANTLVSLGIPILPAAFIIAAALRASQGSATVAILTTAGLLADAAAAYSDNYRVMITIAIGFGGFGFSHINDSFFWILTKYLNMSVSEGLRTWTLITSVIGIVGFFFTWLVTMLFF